MSVRANAPYLDRLEDGGTTLTYEGHDHPKTASSPIQKSLISGALPSGKLTQNGKFLESHTSSRTENAFLSEFAPIRRLALAYGYTTASSISERTGLTKNH